MVVLVQTIAYITLQTTEAYGTFLISAFSFSFFGHCLAFNLQFVGNAEPTGFASNMLNLSKIFVTYFSCDSHSTFLVLYRTMYIPKICFPGPRSFMANNLPSAFFKLPIFLVSCLTINVSSTYNKIIKKSPSFYLLRTQSDQPVSSGTYVLA